MNHKCHLLYNNIIFFFHKKRERRIEKMDEKCKTLWFISLITNFGKNKARIYLLICIMSAIIGKKRCLSPIWFLYNHEFGIKGWSTISKFWFWNKMNNICMYICLRESQKAHDHDFYQKICTNLLTLFLALIIYLFTCWPPGQDCIVIKKC